MNNKLKEVETAAKYFKSCLKSKGYDAYYRICNDYPRYGSYYKRACFVLGIKEKERVLGHFFLYSVDDDIKIDIYSEIVRKNDLSLNEFYDFTFTMMMNND